MEWIEFYYSKEHDEMRKGAGEHGNVLFVSYGDFDMDQVSKFFKVISSTKALILKARGMDSRLVSCFVFQALNFFNNVSNHVELNLMKFSELLKYEVEDFAGVGEWEDRIEEYVGLSNSLVTWAPRYSLGETTTRSEATSWENISFLHNLSTVLDWRFSTPHHRYVILTENENLHVTCYSRYSI